MKRVWIAGLFVLGGCMGPSQQPQGNSKPNWQQTVPPIPAPPPAPGGLEVAPALRASAKQELAAALASGDALIRMHAIEAAKEALGVNSREVILPALKDPEPAIRFAALVAVGDLRFIEAKPVVTTLLTDKVEHVQVAAVYAMHRLGDTRYSEGLELALKNPDPNIRANAAFLLGRLGERSAIKILMPALQDKAVEVRLQAAEALWRLGNEDGLKLLVAGSLSAHPAQQMVAILALAGPHDARVIEHVRAGLSSDYLEVRLVTARALGILGSDEAFVAAVNATSSKEARQQQLAALALGAIGRPDAQQSLAPLLKDADADVRLGAAQAILQLK